MNTQRETSYLQLNGKMHSFIQVDSFGDDTSISIYNVEPSDINELIKQLRELQTKLALKNAFQDASQKSVVKLAAESLMGRLVEKYSKDEEVIEWVRIGMSLAASRIIREREGVSISEAKAVYDALRLKLTPEEA